MKIKKQKKKSNKKLLLGSLAIVLLIIGLAFWYASANKLWFFADTNKSINYGPATEDEKKAGEDVKNSNAGEQNKPTNPDQSPPTTPNNDGTNNVGVKITAANQDGMTFYVRALIQTVTSSGTCTLTMAGPSNKAYSATAAVQALPSTTTCAGFNIPVSSLAPGNWTVTVNFENSNLKGSVSQEVSIQ